MEDPQGRQCGDQYLVCSCFGGAYSWLGLNDNVYAGIFGRFRAVANPDAFLPDRFMRNRRFTDEVFDPASVVFGAGRRC